MFFRVERRTREGLPFLCVEISAILEHNQNLSLSLHVHMEERHPEATDPKREKEAAMLWEDVGGKAMQLRCECGRRVAKEPRGRMSPPGRGRAAHAGRPKRARLRTEAERREAARGGEEEGPGEQPDRSRGSRPPNRPDRQEGEGG